MPSKIEKSLKRTLFFVFLFVFSDMVIYAQCSDGTQPECTCETAPVLCSVDQLDNYVFSMSPYSHPWDGPTPICPDKSDTQTNNPTWFAFTAWCSDLTLRATPSNCQEVFFLVGLQIVIYEDCTFQTAVACDVAAEDCNANAKVLVMTGLTIGGVYYFMVDGCFGSDCTVTIDVVGVCGEEEITPWTSPVTGEAQPCTGNSETYTVEDLVGASMYHWFLDGVLIDESPSNSIDILWANPGSYELCIDVSHEPCVSITNNPPPLCMTINVAGADAGVLSVPLSTLCLNELALLSSTGYMSDADNTQIIVVTDAAGVIVSVIPAAQGFFTSGTPGTFSAYAYNFLNVIGTIPTVGSNISDIDCSMQCCDLISQTITFQGIQATASNIVCHDNGTGNDDDDDTFTFDLLVTGQTPGTNWQSADGTLTGTYGTIHTFGPYQIVDGTLNFIIQDEDIPTCQTNIEVLPPASCSVCLQSVDAGEGSTLDCANTMVTLMGMTSEVGTYNWFGPDAFMSNSLSPMVSNPGWYYLVVEFANQCSLTDSVFITLDTNTPTMEAGQGSTITCTNTTATLSGTISGTGIYYWSGPDSFISETLTITVSDSGWYYLNVQFDNQCINIDSAFVDMDTETPFANAGSDQILDCHRTPVFIDGSGSVGSDFEYSWTNSSGLVVSTQSGFFIDMADTYTLAVFNAINGCVSTDDVVVSADVNTPEWILAEVIPETCEGENDGVIEVTGVTGGTSPFTYWLNGIETNFTGTFSGLTPGEYMVQITDSSGCMIDTMFTIGQGIDLQVELPPFIELLEGQSGFIEAIVSVPTEDLSIIQWTPPGLMDCDTCLSTTINAEGNYSFLLTVIHDQGCIATAEVNITVVPETEMYIPNIFSPNGDGVNDYFTLYANDRVEKILELNVFDRWGSLVFQQTNFDVNDEVAGWDGMYKGQPMLPAMFVYFFKVLRVDGITEIISGDVTLLR